MVVLAAMWLSDGDPRWDVGAWVETFADEISLISGVLEILA